MKTKSNAYVTAEWRKAPPGYPDLRIKIELGPSMFGEGTVWASLEDAERLRAELDAAIAVGRPSHPIDIVFDGPPGHFGPRFIEAEIDGNSAKVGEWIERPDGLWALRIPR